MAQKPACDQPIITSTPQQEYSNEVTVVIYSSEEDSDELDPRTNTQLMNNESLA